MLWLYPLRGCIRAWKPALTHLLMPISHHGTVLFTPNRPKSRFWCHCDRCRCRCARLGTNVRLIPLLPMHMRSVECPISWIELVRVPLLTYFSAFEWVVPRIWGAVGKHHPSTMAPSFASWLAGARGPGRQAGATWTRGACTPHRPSVALFRGCVERTAFGA